MTPDARLSYAGAIAGLTERGRFGIRMGLGRVERLMAEVGRPDLQLRGALVGGTNGKGSVVAMARAVLAESGCRIGTMPKPHLVSYRERIAIDGQPITEDEFADAVAAVLPAADRIAGIEGPPTEFEVLTAVAIGELARQRVDLALVEVGMGGRLDATNVLDLGVAAITNVQRDHEAHLGSTLTAIGTEKAAIIKRGNLAVTGATGRGVRPILDRCASLHAPLRRAGGPGSYRAMVRSVDWDGTTLDAWTPAGELRDIRLGLIGAHQAANAAVALALLDAVAERFGLSVDERQIRRGLSGARWPGRLELLDARRIGLRRVLLDGAHNPDGARALATALHDLGVERPTIVFGAMRDKRVGAVLGALAPLAPRFIFTAVDDPHALGPAELAAAWRRVGGGAAETATTPQDAMAMADADLVVVAGSLYLVGAVRGMITGRAGSA